MKRDEKRPKWWYEETDPAGVDYDWVMEGLLARAGFEIESAESHGRLQATYVCAKSGP